MMARVLRITPVALSVLVAGLVAGCAFPNMETVEQTTQGPTALDVLTARSVAVNGREPTFDERRHWEDETELRIAKYLREHPELEQTPRYSELRFWRQVAPGATKDEVKLLLDEPQERTIDPALMAMLAERHWPEIARRATEAWEYYGWAIYFEDSTVVDMVRRVSRLEPRYD
jgi:hypothetical protein